MSISKETMRKLQACQNKVLRLISHRDYETPTSELLTICNQLSVHQLVAYHSACQVYKISMSKLPNYHHNRLFNEDNSDRKVEFHLSLAKSNFFYQSSKLWNNLPPEVKQAPNITHFKKLCKSWIKANVPIRP